MEERNGRRDVGMTESSRKKTRDANRGAGKGIGVGGDKG